MWFKNNRKLQGTDHSKRLIMKVAFAAENNTLNSRIDSHFGRCAYFMIYDTNTGEYEFIENPYREIKEQAGCEAVKLLQEKQVERIISSEIGEKVKILLKKLKIQIIIVVETEKTLKDYIVLMRAKN